MTADRRKRPWFHVATLSFPVRGRGRIKRALDRDSLARGRRRPDKRCANYNVARRVPHGERLTLFDSIGDATTPDWIERRSWLKKDDFNVNRFVLIFNFFSIFVQVFLEIRKSF